MSTSSALACPKALKRVRSLTNVNEDGAGSIENSAGHALIRVLVADDEGALRLAICDLIAGESGFEVVAVAADADEAVARARETLPDVALLDVRMPGGGGVRATTELRLVSPQTRVVALSAYADDAAALLMLRAGAVGYLIKGESSPGEIIEAIHRATRGQASFPAVVAAALVTALAAEETERDDRRCALRSSEQRFSRLIESAPDAIAISDADGKIVLVNLEAERLFGYGREELLGQPIELLVPLRLREAHARARAEYAVDPRRRPMGSGMVLTALRKDGREVQVDISLSLSESAEGALVTAFIRDISDREAKKDLEQRVSLKQRVLGYLVTAIETERRRIAEDIHDDSIQAMAAAGMRLQILRKSIGDPGQLERLDELGEAIRLAIARLRRLISELRPTGLDNDGLAAALESYLEAVAHTGTTSYQLNDRLTSEPSSETGLVVYRIAQEALNNVAKHARAAHGTVTLAERNDGYLIRVEDDGVGFVPGSIPEQPGHLGLAALRERAELADGWLRVESAPNQGTTVEFWIPPINEAELEGVT